MEFFIASIAALFGAIVGSFNNVLILRYYTGTSLSGRSCCPACNTKLQWYELIPLVSYIALGARCRSCRNAISIQYPLVELATAASFFGIAFVVSPVSLLSSFSFALYAIFASMLIVIFVYDLYYFTIPDIFVSIAALAALFTHAVSASGFVFPSLSVFFAGLILGAPIALLWFISRGRWIGLGDAKLAIAVGWFFGLSVGTSVLVIAVWLGALIGLALLALQRVHEMRAVQRTWLAGAVLPRTIRSEIPFGPFIIASVILHIFTDVTALKLLRPLTFSL